MDSRLKTIFDETIPHSSFLDERSILSCMYQSYQLACDDLFQWLSDNDYLTDEKKIIQKEFFDRQKQKL